MISTRAMAGAGLKKCRPMNRPGRVVMAASSEMLRLEVFDARMVWAGQTLSSAWYSVRFQSTFSAMASITRSASATSAVSWTLTTPLILAVISAGRPASILPFSTILPRLLLMMPKPRWTNSSLMSPRTTSYPASATTWAMPAPMVPAPTTTTFLIMPGRYFLRMTAALLPAAP